MLRIVCVCLIAASVASAQPTGSSQPYILTGREVRVHSDAYRSPVRGEWVGVVGDSAHVTLGRGAKVAIPTASISRIDENRGRQRGLYAVIGAAAGMLVGGIAMAASIGDGDGLAAAAGFTVGGLVGAVVGAPIGFFWAPERWTTHVVRP
jgi:hypothetical protein